MQLTCTRKRIKLISNKQIWRNYSNLSQEVGSGRMEPDLEHVNPFMPTVAFNMCCPRDCVSRHNGDTTGAPLKPLRDDSALRALSSLRGLRGAPAGPPL